MLAYQPVPGFDALVLFAHHLDDLRSNVADVERIALNGYQPLEIHDVLAAEEEKLENTECFGRQEPRLLAIDRLPNARPLRFPRELNAGNEYIQPHTAKVELQHPLLFGLATSNHLVGLDSKRSQSREDVPKQLWPAEDVDVNIDRRPRHPVLAVCERTPKCIRDARFLERPRNAKPGLNGVELLCHL